MCYSHRRLKSAGLIRLSQILRLISNSLWKSQSNEHNEQSSDFVRHSSKSDFLMAAIWGGHDLYVRWQEKRLVRRAMFDIEHGNERDASLAARSILEMKPSSARAARIMAQLAERGANVLRWDWRRRVVQLDPHSVGRRAGTSSVRRPFSDIPTAELTLVAVDENSRKYRVLSRSFCSGGAVQTPG